VGLPAADATVQLAVVLSAEPNLVPEPRLAVGATVETPHVIVVLPDQNAEATMTRPANTLNEVTAARVADCPPSGKLTVCPVMYQAAMAARRIAK